MEIDKILSRIGIDTQDIEINLENLKKLQESYILNVPYENLDFVLNRGFNVNIFKIYEKIVENNRGGICYESNTLFAYLLNTLGFNVKMIFAKVDDLTYIGKDYPHLTLIVTIDNKEYLVDVANGQNVREPMYIEDERFISIAEQIEYRISKQKDFYSLEFNHRHKGWTPRYHFKIEEKNVSDFEGVFKDEGNMEHFSNHAPLLVTQALKNGRVTLTDEQMTLKEDENKKSWNISLENRAEVLRDYFKMEI